MIEYTMYRWDSLSLDWSLYDYALREVHSYDTNGNKTEMYHYHWYPETNEWRESCKRYLFSYDANHNLTEEITYVWDDISSRWTPYYRTLNTCNVEGNLIETIDFISSELIVSSDVHLDKGIIEIFPNPFTDFTNVKLISKARY